MILLGVFIYKTGRTPIKYKLVVKERLNKVLSLFVFFSLVRFPRIHFLASRLPNGGLPITWRELGYRSSSLLLAPGCRAVTRPLLMTTVCTWGLYGSDPGHNRWASSGSACFGVLVELLRGYDPAFWL